MDEFKVEDLEKMQIICTKETVGEGNREATFYYVESFSGFITFDELRALPAFKRERSFESFQDNVFLFCQSGNQVLNIFEPAPQIQTIGASVPKGTPVFSLRPGKKLYQDEYEQINKWLQIFKHVLKTSLQIKISTVIMK